MSTVRIGSYNCENFFSRAILLNKDWDEAKPFLEKFAELQKELAKDAYDKPAIKALLDELDPYIVVRNNRGKFATKSNTTGKWSVKAEGRAEWEGSVELKRRAITSEGQRNTIRVLKAMNADILCIVEIEDRDVLQRMGRYSDLLNTAQRYIHNMLVDGNDDRGIDVGALSRHPISEVRSHVHDYNLNSAGNPNLNSPIFSRDCLEARVEIPGGKPLWLLCNHLKSQGYGSPASSNAKRKSQCDRLVQILQRFNLQQDYVVVAGDLNADGAGNWNASAVAAAASMASLLGVQGLTNVVADKLPADHWTYVFSGHKQQLDYLLVSHALMQHYAASGVERRGIAEIATHTGGAVQPFPTITSEATAASDHAAVWAEFDVP